MEIRLKQVGKGWGWAIADWNGREVASGGSDFQDDALKLANEKVKELTEPKFPAAADWFERCTPEEAVFRDGGGWSFFVLTVAADKGRGSVDLCDGFASPDGAAQVARNALPGCVPVRPRRGLK